MPETDPTKAGLWIDFVVHFPFEIKEEDREGFIRAAHEIFFGQTRLSSYAEEALAARKLDVNLINEMLREDRLATNPQSLSPHMELLAKQKNIHIRRGVAFRVSVHTVTSAAAKAVVEASRSFDGRKALFTTLRPMRGISITNELDLAILMEETVGSYMATDLPSSVASYLRANGVDPDELARDPRPALNRLSPESSAMLRRYGHYPEDCSAIEIRVDPQLTLDTAETQNFLSFNKLDVHDFGSVDEPWN